MASAQYEVFICHRRNDAADLSIGIHRYLNDQGIPTFCDLIDDPAYGLGAAIYGLILATPVFLLIATNGAIVSLDDRTSWITLELQCALDARRHVVVLDLGAKLQRNVARSTSAHAQRLPRPKVTFCDSAPSPAGLRTLRDVVRAELPLKLDEALSDITIEDVVAMLDGTLGSVPPGSHVSGFANELSREITALQRAGADGNDVRALADSLVGACERAVLRRALVAGVVRALSRCGKNGALFATDVRPLWPLIHASLNGDSGLATRVTRSAQGFLVIPLYANVQGARIKELLRLHVWLPGEVGLERRSGLDSFSIHAHQPHAQSWILAGELCNQVYAVHELTGGTPTAWTLFQLNWDGTRKYAVHQTASTVTNTNRPVQVSIETTAHFRRGQTYEVPAGEFHRTTCPLADTGHGAATLFFFDASRGWEEDAPVVGPANVNMSTVPRHVALDPAGWADAVDAWIRQ